MELRKVVNLAEYKSEKHEVGIAARKKFEEMQEKSGNRIDFTYCYLEILDIFMRKEYPGAFSRFDKFLGEIINNK